MVAVLPWLTTPVAARAQEADTKLACVDAHEQGQRLRAAGKLIDAQDRFASCGREACPDRVRAACAELLEHVQQELPTVVIDARDKSHHDTLEVRLSIDGVVVRSRLDANGIPVDPGEHVFRFEAEGSPVVLLPVVVRTGDKNRHLSVDFAAPPALVVPPPPPRPPSPTRHSPVLGYVFMGVTLAAMGSFAYFAVAGKNLEGDRTRSCSPVCTDDQVSPIRTDYVVADISLGVATATAVLAVVFLVRGYASHRVTMSIVPRRADGATLQLGGVF